MKTPHLMKGIGWGGIILIMVLAPVMVSGAGEGLTKIPQSPHACRECHICETPTSGNPCLGPCPFEWCGKKAGTDLRSNEVPNVARMDVLEKLYDPVVFNHRLHAEMAEMSVGCVACHHHTPTAASHPPCRECHAVQSNSHPSDMLGLKGAYHRQCMDCHREWSGQDDCENCHRAKGERKGQEKVYAAGTNRQCKEPDQQTYETTHRPGRYVTFFHENHSQHYGLACSECHRQESCVACHYQGQKPVAVVKAAADVMHHKCSACHDIQSKPLCVKCHQDKAGAAFSHTRATGWDLGRHHTMLTCASCHPPDRRISRPQGDCDGCHQDWSMETFDHGVVGLMLDEDHLDNDCTDCHQERRFEKPPTCVECHDDKQYPDEMPGEKVNRPVARKG